MLESRQVFIKELAVSASRKKEQLNGVQVASGGKGIPGWQSDSKSEKCANGKVSYGAHQGTETSLQEGAYCQWCAWLL